MVWVQAVLLESTFYLRAGLVQLAGLDTPPASAPQFRKF